jgi:hypothetical protein
MTITSFEVAAVFKIVDEATGILRRMGEQVAAFDRIVIKTTENLALLGRVTFPGLSGELKSLSAQAEALKTTFGAVTSSMNSSVAATTGEVNALGAAWTRVANEARAAAAAARTGGIGAAGAGSLLPNANLRARAGAHGGRAPLHGYASVPLPAGMHARAGIGMGPAIAGSALLYGMAEQAELEDATFQMMWHAGLPNTGENKQRFRDLIQSTASQTGFDYKTIAEAATDEIRLLKAAAGKESGGVDILPEMLRAAAVEARVKPGTTLITAMQSLVQQAHMAQEYGLEDIKGAAPLLAFLSTTNPATMQQMTRAASYAMPTLHSALNMDPADVLFETTALARAGATNTKSGTWVRSAFERSLPGQFDNKERTEAMRQVGLVDEAGKSTVLDATGKHIDIDKLLRTVFQATQTMSIEDKNSYLKKVFGEQGERGITLLMSPAVMQQTAELKKEFPEFKNRYSTFFEDYEKGSPIQQARKSWMDVTNVLSDLGTVVLPVAVSGLRSLDEILKNVTTILPKGISGSEVAAAAGVSMMTGGLGLPHLAVEGVKHLFGFGGAVTDTGSAADKAAGSVRELNGSINGLGGAALGVGPAIRSLKGVPEPEKHSMNFIPPSKGERPVVLSSTLNIDGRTLAEQVSEHLASLFEHPTSAPAANGLAYITAPDSGWGVG